MGRVLNYCNDHASQKKNTFLLRLKIFAQYLHMNLRS